MRQKACHRPSNGELERPRRSKEHALCAQSTNGAHSAPPQPSRPLQALVRRPLQVRAEKRERPMVFADVEASGARIVTGDPNALGKRLVTKISRPKFIKRRGNFLLLQPEPEAGQDL